MSKNDDSNPVASLIGMLIVLGIGIVIAACVGVTDGPGATRILSAQGFANIRMTGYRWFAGTGDWYHTGFEADAPNGTHVTGCVGSGLLCKGHTVRLD